jgi:hypothetical protein
MVDFDSYAAIEKGTPLAFMLVEGQPARIGARPCANWLVVMLALELAAAWAVAYALWVMQTLPWWDRRRVSEPGSGPL